MEWKELIKQGTKQLKQAAAKIQDKEFRTEKMQKVAGILSEKAKTAAEITTETVSKTKEYIDENRLAPGAKESYIADLEEQIAKKDKEIERLKKIIKKNHWSKKK